MFDCDGNVWFTGNHVGIIGKLDPKTGVWTNLKVPKFSRSNNCWLIYGSMAWDPVNKEIVSMINRHGRLAVGLDKDGVAGLAAEADKALAGEATVVRAGRRHLHVEARLVRESDGAEAC